MEGTLQDRMRVSKSFEENWKFYFGVHFASILGAPHFWKVPSGSETGLWFTYLVGNSLKLQRYSGLGGPKFRTWGLRSAGFGLEGPGSLDSIIGYVYGYLDPNSM